MYHFRFLLNHKLLILSIFVVGFVSSILEGLGISFILPILDTSNSSEGIPFPFNHLIDFFVGWETAEKLQIAAVLLVLTMALKNVFLFVGVFVGTKIQIETIKHFQSLCFEQLLKVGIEYINSRKGGDFHTIIANHTHNIVGLVGAIPILIIKLTNFLVYTFLIFLLSWEMTLLSILLSIVSSLILGRLIARAHRVGKNHTKEYYNLNNASLELISGMKLIRFFSNEASAKESLMVRLDKYGKAVFNYGTIKGMVQPLFEIFAVTGLGVILFVSSNWLFQSGNMGIPVLVTFLAIFQRMSSIAQHVNQFRVTFASSLAGCKEVFEFLDEEDKGYLENGEKKIDSFKKGIIFKNVSFTYKNRTESAINDVNFFLEKGKKTGIVGFSGSGKSTITELLLRFYDPQKGEILIDGVSLKQLDVHSWRSYIGLVSQEVFLINDTIRNNIAYGKPEASQSEIESTALKAHAHEFIQQQPEGYDTIMGDRGVLFSGGQKQRIAIARAILINPEILIFDEATSSLDTESEKIVQKALDVAGKGRTVITIAHRLSTIFDSDKIIVLESGKIAEEGTHQELIQKDGMYKNLLQMQELPESSGALL